MADAASLIDAPDLSLSARAVPAGGPRADTSFGRLLTILAALAALGTLATNILLPSLATIAKSFGITTSAMGPALSGYFATFALAQLVAGPLSDRFGRRPLVLGGLALFILGTVWCTMATSLHAMVAGRIVQAIGVCAPSVLARAIARDLFEGAQLARLMSYIMVAMAAAPGFSPIVGSGLETAFGWQAAFVFVGVFGLAAGIAYVAFVGETHLQTRARLDPMSILRGYIGLARDRRFIVPAPTVALIMGSLFAIFTASAAVLMDGLHFSPLGLALFFAGTVFVVFAAGMLAPRLAARVGAAPAVRVGLAIACLGGLSMLALAAIAGHSFAAYLGPAVVFLFGMGLVNPLGTALTLSPFGDRAGLASALLGFMQMSGAAIGAAAATALPVAPIMALALVVAVFSVAATGIFLARQA